MSNLINILQRLFANVSTPHMTQVISTQGDLDLLQMNKLTITLQSQLQLPKEEVDYVQLQLQASQKLHAKYLTKLRSIYQLQQQFDHFYGIREQMKSFISQCTSQQSRSNETLFRNLLILKDSTTKCSVLLQNMRQLAMTPVTQRLKIPTQQRPSFFTEVASDAWLQSSTLFNIFYVLGYFKNEVQSVVGKQFLQTVQKHQPILTARFVLDSEEPMFSRFWDFASHQVKNVEFDSTKQLTFRGLQYLLDKEKTDMVRYSQYESQQKESFLPALILWPEDTTKPKRLKTSKLTESEAQTQPPPPQNAQTDEDHPAVDLNEHSDSLSRSPKRKTETWQFRGNSQRARETKELSVEEWREELKKQYKQYGQDILKPKTVTQQVDAKPVSRDSPGPEAKAEAEKQKQLELLRQLFQQLKLCEEEQAFLFKNLYSDAKRRSYIKKLELAIQQLEKYRQLKLSYDHALQNAILRAKSDQTVEFLSELTDLRHTTIQLTNSVIEIQKLTCSPVDPTSFQPSRAVRVLTHWLTEHLVVYVLKAIKFPSEKLEELAQKVEFEQNAIQFLFGQRLPEVNDLAELFWAGVARACGRAQTMVVGDHAELVVKQAENEYLRFSKHSELLKRCVENQQAPVKFPIGDNIELYGGRVFVAVEPKIDNQLEQMLRDKYEQNQVVFNSSLKQQLQNEGEYWRKITATDHFNSAIQLPSVKVYSKDSKVKTPLVMDLGNTSQRLTQYSKLDNISIKSNDFDDDVSEIPIVQMEDDSIMKRELSGMDKQAPKSQPSQSSQLKSNGSRRRWRATNIEMGEDQEEMKVFVASPQVKKVKTERLRRAEEKPDKSVTFSQLQAPEPQQAETHLSIVNQSKVIQQQTVQKQDVIIVIIDSAGKTQLEINHIVSQIRAGQNYADGVYDPQGAQADAEVQTDDHPPQVAMTQTSRLPTPKIESERNIYVVDARGGLGASKVTQVSGVAPKQTLEDVFAEAAKVLEAPKPEPEKATPVRPRVIKSPGLLSNIEDEAKPATAQNIREDGASSQIAEPAPEFKKPEHIPVVEKAPILVEENLVQEPVKVAPEKIPSMLEQKPTKTESKEDTETSESAKLQRQKGVTKTKQTPKTRTKKIVPKMKMVQKQVEASRPSPKSMVVVRDESVTSVKDNPFTKKKEEPVVVKPAPLVAQSPVKPKESPRKSTEKSKETLTEMYEMIEVIEEYEEEITEPVVM